MLKIQQQHAHTPNLPVLPLEEGLAGRVRHIWMAPETPTVKIFFAAAEERERQ